MGGIGVTTGIDASVAARFAQLALACLHREYPNKIAPSLNSDADVLSPQSPSETVSECGTCGPEVLRSTDLLTYLQVLCDILVLGSQQQ